LAQVVGRIFLIGMFRSEIWISHRNQIRILRDLLWYVLFTQLRQSPRKSRITSRRRLDSSLHAPPPTSACLLLYPALIGLDRSFPNHQALSQLWKLCMQRLCRHTRRRTHKSPETRIANLITRILPQLAWDLQQFLPWH